jgi:hypothetical protein
MSDLNNQIQKAMHDRAKNAHKITILEYIGSGTDQYGNFIILPDGSILYPRLVPSKTKFGYKEEEEYNNGKIE